MVSLQFVILVSSVDDQNITYVMERSREIQQAFPSSSWIVVHLAAGLSKTKLEMKEGLQGLDQVNKLSFLIIFYSRYLIFKKQYLCVKQLHRKKNFAEF